ncbi:penicillin-binding protein 2 [Coleofasciculus sp. FACHB-64]|uniref:penicillin-binding protein 2 n=1 Tax=Cyanophyceae TaxID=3028117 RepID=UPI001684C262|nr:MULTISPECIES: penicillin-binding protein 2 [unclassified Coleofasciculus]MBD1837814.1 penicillin-binding protein 2 [Coleofasciculus sp. FACHB-501]MBD1881188.1 penicillin-binding protein 2 [Coleofasciculus sp. FACHB-T130]MBD1888134.1 penicillin-binding protein 2 [Coleofasciculus sp. FACHB-SPT9]MBD1893303.1 penicillin-binding protein 2 [Coleofasciculus sp. FACHB-129]MBD1902765.1 penicillin-binding protein 2 [Coleofasciculus sp. FACHB-125]
MTLIARSSSIGRQSTPRTVGRRLQSVIIMLLVTLLLAGGIGARLVFLQVVQGERNRQLAENNRIRLIPKQPARGTIFDRKGRVLASSRLSHSVFLWPIARKQKDWPATLSRLSELLNVPEKEIQKQLEKAGYTSTSLLRIARDINPAQITALEEYRSQLEGVEVDIEGVRNYPNAEVGAHVLGYTGEMNDEELAKMKDQGYRLGDVIGQMGVEAAFEKPLRGEWGGQQVEVDGAGQVLRILGQKKAKAGKDVQLTLDLDLQKAAERALGDRKGAIVAMDPNNGAILAMVSRPGFDPNVFSKRITPETWKKVQSKGNPFVNRALRVFPPASTFKIVTASAAIESGKYSPNTVLATYPYLTVGGIRFGEWNHAGFGPLGFVGALAMSSDTFFYQIGKGIGGPTLIDWTRKYGFGQKTGIELASEELPGLVADAAWKEKRLKQEWTIGDTVNMSIGQGFLQTTPLQVAVMFAVPANGGYRVKPHLLKDNEASKNWRESLNMKPETLRVVRQGLRSVVTSGTGKAVNAPTLPPVAGKSGTAEAPPGLSHAWFGAYAPADKPKIVVVAFAEHSGGGGGKVAAPMVLKVLEAYFQVKKPVKPVK